MHNFLLVTSIINHKQNYSKIFVHSSTYHKSHYLAFSSESTFSHKKIISPFPVPASVGLLHQTTREPLRRPLETNSNSNKVPRVPNRRKTSTSCRTKTTRRRERCRDRQQPGAHNSAGGKDSAKIITSSPAHNFLTFMSLNISHFLVQQHNNKEKKNVCNADRKTLFFTHLCLSRP